MVLNRLGPYFYAGHAMVYPGRYDVGLDVDGKCWGDTLITVLPGHDRDVGVQVSPLGSGHHDVRAAIYGTLPVAGFTRRKLVVKDFELPVEIDGSAYYVEFAFPGKSLLELSYGDDLECRIPVDIPEHGMRLDVDVQLAQRCIGFPHHYPSTGERGFVPLFVSPSPSPTSTTKPK